MNTYLADKLAESAQFITCVLAAAWVLVTFMTQCQQTERTKFEHGYEQRVEVSSATAVTGPMWRKGAAPSPEGRADR